MMISITRWLAALRDYRRSLVELDALTDRDLRDIGIARDDVSRVAWREARRASGLDEDQAEQASKGTLAPVTATSR